MSNTAPMIIGLCGKAGSGKSTVARILAREHGFVEVALADPIKRICRDVFAFTDEQLWGPSEKRNEPDLRYRRVSEADAKTCSCGALFRDGEDFRDHLPCSARGPVHLTPRHALQQLGTEWGRACYPDVWVDLTLRIAEQLLHPQQADSYTVNYYSPAHGLQFVGGAQRPKGVVISDVRFPNEVAAIRAKGGHIWKTSHGSGLEGVAAAHVSEQHIDSLEVDYRFPTGMQLVELPNAVKYAIEMVRP